MKRILFLIPIILFFSLVIFKNQIIFNLARKNIQKALPQSKVEIKQIEFHPFSYLRFRGVNIRYPLSPDFISLEEVNIDYALTSLLKGEIKKVEIVGLDVSLQDVVRVKTGKPLFKIKEMVISGKIKFRDLEVKDIKVGIQRLGDNQLKGNLGAKAINIKKVRVDKLNVRLGLSTKADTLSCEELKFSIFGANINGRLNTSFTKSGINYELNMDGKGIDLKQIIEELELKEKLEVTGRCDLVLKAEGEGKRLTELNAELIAQGSGKFNIKDKQALGRLHSLDRPSLDLVLESLKNYQYDKGKAVFYLEDSNIVAHIMMTGPQGARDLTVVWHLPLPKSN